MKLHILILVLVQVQANHLALTSSSEGPLHICLTNKIEVCKLHSRLVAYYEWCIVSSFLHCVTRIKEEDDPILFPIIHRCALDCLHSHEGKRATTTACLIECYEKHIKKRMDVVYMQNP